jgi:hypothetical protein
MGFMRGGSNRGLPSQRDTGNLGLSTMGRGQENEYTQRSTDPLPWVSVFSGANCIHVSTLSLLLIHSHPPQ